MVIYLYVSNITITIFKSLCINLTYDKVDVYEIELTDVPSALTIETPEAPWTVIEPAFIFLISVIEYKKMM